jgi:hypothetical protein
MFNLIIIIQKTKYQKLKKSGRNGTINLRTIVLSKDLKQAAKEQSPELCPKLI